MRKYKSFIIQIFFILLLVSCQNDELLNNAKAITDYSKKPVARISFYQNGNSQGPFRSGPIVIQADFSEKLESTPNIEIKQSGQAPAEKATMKGSEHKFTFTYQIKDPVVPQQDMLLPALERKCTSFALLNALYQNQAFDCPAPYQNGEVKVTIYIGKKQEPSYFILGENSFEINTLPDSTPANNSSQISPFVKTITVTFQQNMDTAILPKFYLGKYSGNGIFSALPMGAHQLKWLDNKTLEIQNIPNKLTMLPENIPLGWILGESKTEGGETPLPFVYRFTTTTHAITFKSPLKENNKPATDRFQNLHPNSTDWLVQDSETGLFWQKCILPTEASGTGDTCLGDPSTYSIYEAMSMCSALNLKNNGAGYGNKNGWHIPTIRELMTLAYYDSYVETSQNPFHIINLTYFPNSVATKYATLTFFEEDDSQIWTFNFSLGLNQIIPDTTRLLIHCVDSSEISTHSGAKDYVSHPTLSQTYIDLVTGKEWHPLQNSFYNTLANAQSHCNNSSSKHPDEPTRTLRLPDIYEYMSLARYSKFENTIMFTEYPARPYWTNRQLLNGFYQPAATELYYTYSFLEGVQYHEQHITTLGYVLCIVNP